MSHPFDQHYFHGGGKVGGYAREGYADWPQNWTTYAKLMELKPLSVLEVGCAKGFILKRLEDSGVRVQGFDISEHCRLTRAIENVATWDITKTPWPIEDASFDLAFSKSVFEHIPEDKLPAVFSELVRTCKRGLHGIDYLEGDDGFDQTHVTLRDERWWKLRLPAGHDCVEAKTLEAGPVPTPLGNGVKLNLGSFTNCFHYSWKNIDVIDVGAWARPLGYQFIHHDVKNGLPFDDDVVHYVFSSHMAEHLTYDEGAALFKECHRVMKTGGLMRILVPDASKLIDMYAIPGTQELRTLDEMSDTASRRTTDVAKLYELLCAEHRALYDWETMEAALKAAGFTTVEKMPFRRSKSPVMQRETMDMYAEMSLIVEAVK